MRSRKVFLKSGRIKDKEKSMTLNLIDINSQMITAWQYEFTGCPDVRIIQGSIFETPSEAIVSPANSFGIMDGGLDGKIRDFLGMDVERNVRKIIADDYSGELPVGCAILSKTGHPQFRYLITAPTMRVPEEVSDSLNAYLSMRAILNLLKKHPHIHSVSIPGLCALSGRMPYPVVARQMRTAYDKIVTGKIQYSHWREEKYLQDYLMCRTDILPDDLERK
jgi:O-acetyl-ADP-ribose deacetylase (regulator of RNase III)